MSKTGKHSLRSFFFLRNFNYVCARTATCSLIGGIETCAQSIYLSFYLFEHTHKKWVKMKYQMISGRRQMIVMWVELIGMESGYTIEWKLLGSKVKKLDGWLLSVSPQPSPSQLFASLHLVRLSFSSSLANYLHIMRIVCMPGGIYNHLSLFRSPSDHSARYVCNHTHAHNLKRRKGKSINRFLVHYLYVWFWEEEEEKNTSRFEFIGHNRSLCDLFYQWNDCHVSFSLCLLRCLCAMFLFALNNTSINNSNNNKAFKKYFFIFIFCVFLLSFYNLYRLWTPRIIKYTKWN